MIQNFARVEQYLDPEDIAFLDVEAEDGTVRG
jgi:hypothetical protein